MQADLSKLSQDDVDNLLFFKIITAADVVLLNTTHPTDKQRAALVKLGNKIIKRLSRPVERVLF